MKKIIKRFLGLSLLDIRSFLLKHKDNQKYNEFLRNRKFKDMYKGKRCFILGNGPSLKSVDFSLLSDEITFTVNQLPRNPEFDKLNTNFHFWSDDVFFDLHKDKPEDIELLNVMKKVKSKKNNPVVFYRYSGRKMIKEFELEKELDIYYFEDSNVDLSKIEKGFIKCDRYLPSFKTVVQYAVCFAVYMGFKEIILLGCDCSSIITLAQSRLGKAEESYYGYAITQNDKKKLESIEADRTFDDELHSQAVVIETYGLLDRYCKANNARLLNATNPTLLDSVERVTLDSVLKQKNL